MRAQAASPVTYAVIDTYRAAVVVGEGGGGNERAFPVVEDA